MSDSPCTQWVTTPGNGARRAKCGEPSTHYVEITSGIHIEAQYFACEKHAPTPNPPNVYVIDLRAVPHPGRRH